MSQPCQLILFPGLGADARLLEPQRQAFPEMIVPPWIPPRRSESLSRYAARLAEGLPCRRPCVLGGVSLGGMVALEVARHVRPDLVVLIASCRSGRAVRRTAHTFRHLDRFISPRVFHAGQWIAPLAAHGILGLTPQQRRSCVAMFQDAEGPFMHWALGALLRWTAEPLADIPVLHIHGQRDLPIPLANVQADEVIPDGGHLINLTHADAVNAFLRRAIDSVCG